MTRSKLPGSPLRTYNGEERRSKARINEALPAKVSGVDVIGQAFESETVLDNLSSTGLYLRLRDRVDKGAKLRVVVQMSVAQSERQLAPNVAAKGVVLRSDPQPDGTCGVAVVFTRHRVVSV